jgi:hypothetical protein
MGGKAFTMDCTITTNGYGTPTAALIDSGANGFSFINTLLAYDIAKFHGLKVSKLPRPIRVKGYDNKVATSATRYIRFGLLLDHRKFVNMPFVILDIGNHDVILGKTFFEYYNTKLDVKGRKLLWPPTLLPSMSVLRPRIIARELLLPQDISDATKQQYQTDIERRDKLLAQEDGMLKTTICDFTAATANTTFTVPNTAATKATVRNAVPQTAYVRKQWTGIPNTALATATPIDIAVIGAVGMHFNLKRPENEGFYTSLYEIDRQLDDFEHTTSTSTDQDLPDRVPSQYHEFLDVFSKQESDILPPHRAYDHKIELEGPNTLGFSPLYKMNETELRTVKQYIVDNLHKGFIEHSQSPFAAPILFVKKPNGSLRFCVDYRKLNALTKKDRYPLPLIDETLARIGTAQVFTKLDIRQAFNRIRMDPNSEEFTTFRTRYGTYKSKVLPFGLTNGPATYQRYMNDVLFEYLDDFCSAYLDDILIYSSDPEDHEIHVQKVLQRLRDAGLQADIDKCEFHVTETKYLGFIIGIDGIRVDPSKVEVVRNWKAPNTVRGVQSFLGFCNFYRRFIKDYGRIAKPLNHLTKNTVPFDFNEQCWNAFEELKEKLCSTEVLRHYNPDRKSRIETDSSDGVIAGVLSQLHSENDDDEWRPVAYFSKTMAPAECNYEIHDKELLAIVRSLNEWRPELYSTHHKVMIYTDHKALEYFMTSKQLTARQARWAEMLAEYHFVIMYRSGKHNNADALTRREQDVKEQDLLKKQYRTRTLLTADQLDEAISRELMDEETTLAPIYSENSELIDRLIEINQSAKSIDALRTQAQNTENSPYTMEEGLVLYKGCLIVPDVDNIRTELIREAHDQVSTAHPGRDKTYLLLRSQYTWKNMKNDVSRYVSNCHVCRRTCVPRDKTPGLLHPLPVPELPWQHVSMDFKSFPIDKHGYDNVMVVVDRLSKQAISIPCYKTVTAPQMAKLYLEYVYRYHGPPMSIVSDRGPQFISTYWKAFTAILGIELKLSTANHPQTDGQTEIMNQYLDQRLRPFVNYYQDNWSDLLPMMDYAQLTLPHATIGMSPYELQHGGAKPRTSFDWKQPKTHTDAEQLAHQISDVVQLGRSNMLKAQEKKKNDANKHRRPVDFDVGDKVFLTMKSWTTERPSGKLDNQMAGPYKILEKVGESFRLELPDSMKVHPVFHAEKLRKAPADPLPGQVIEPPPPVVIVEEPEYEVQDIIACKIKYKQLQYRVSWVGYTEPDLQWYPASYFLYSPHKLREFHLLNPLQHGPPKAIDQWVEAYEQGKESYDELSDNTPMTESQKRQWITSHEETIAEICWMPWDEFTTVWAENYEKYEHVRVSSMWSYEN